jgi:hypothetical protein
MNTLQLCIIYYTVAVSVDRYLYVSMGLNASQYCTVRNTLRIILLLTILSIIFVIPYWFKFRVITQIDTQNRTHYKMACTYMNIIFSKFQSNQLFVIDSHIGQQQIFREIVNIYINIPFVHFIPFIILILINILTIRGLIQYHDEHRRLLSTSIRQMAMLRKSVPYPRRHFRVTVMLIGVVLLFLLCRFPMLINQICEVRYSITDNRKIKDNLYFQCRIQRPLNTFANFMQTINSNGNLIIYLVCCQNFREISKELFRKLLNYARFRSNENMIPMLYRSRTSTRSTDM